MPQKRPRMKPEIGKGARITLKIVLGNIKDKLNLHVVQAESDGRRSIRGREKDLIAKLLGKQGRLSGHSFVRKRKFSLD